MKTVTCSFSSSKSIIFTTPDTVYQYPGPVFGAGADGAAGAVFPDIALHCRPVGVEQITAPFLSDVTKHRIGAKCRFWVLVKCVWCGAYY